jgi:hypothetical protein
MDEKAFLDRLDTHNNLMRQLIESMPKSANRFTGIMETAVLIVTVFSAVGIADTIIKWITGE